MNGLFHNIAKFKAVPMFSRFPHDQRTGSGIKSSFACPFDILPVARTYYGIISMELSKLFKGFINFYMFIMKLVRTAYLKCFGITGIFVEILIGNTACMSLIPLFLASAETRDRLSHVSTARGMYSTARYQPETLPLCLYPMHAWKLRRFSRIDRQIAFPAAVTFPETQVVISVELLIIPGKEQSFPYLTHPFSLHKCKDPVYYNTLMDAFHEIYRDVDTLNPA